MDGIIPWLATQMVTALNGFAESYGDIESLTWTGRYLDRRLLVSLDKHAWDSITTDIIQHLTDSVIAEAVHGLPPEMYGIEGRGIGQRARASIDGLKEILVAFDRSSEGKTFVDPGQEDLGFHFRVDGLRKDLIERQTKQE